MLPRQMFEIPIQTMLGSKIIARERLKLLEKCCKTYGGDVTRRRNCLKSKRQERRK